MTEGTALWSLRQAEKNPYAHHNDRTILQSAGREGQQITTAETINHLQNRKDVTDSKQGFQQEELFSSSKSSLIN